MTKQLYGWYSKKAHQALGEKSIAIYRSADGTKNVSCTMVNDSSENPGNYLWPDVVCVGPVGDFIGNRKSRKRPGFEAEWECLVFEKSGPDIIHNIVLENEIASWNRSDK